VDASFLGDVKFPTKYVRDEKIQSMRVLNLMREF